MADTWEALERACGQCQGCSLWETRRHVVFDAGSRTAEVMLVGGLWSVVRFAKRSVARHHTEGGQSHE